MINRPLLLAIVLLFPSLTQASGSPVWLIQNGNNSLYLAGTVHLLRPQDYPLPSAFEIAYRDAEQLVFEMDIRETTTREFQMLMIESMRLPPGTSLSALLTANTLQKLELHLQNNGMSLQHFAGMKPSMIAMTLSVLELQKLGAGSVGVDEFFHDRAVADGKPVVALETAQQQIQMLASMGKDHEDLLIMQTLEELETLQTDFDDMVKAWRSGNREELNALFIEPMKQDFAALYQQLLVNRNMDWLRQIHRMLNTRETEMVLVGSAHLVGTEGLLQQLAKAGYGISRLQ